MLTLLETNKKAKILYKSDTCTLFCDPSQGKLNLQLLIYQPISVLQQQNIKKIPIRKYTKLLYIGHHQYLRANFRQIYHFVDHFNNPANFHIDESQGYIYLNKKGGGQQIGCVIMEEKQVPGIQKHHDEADFFRPAIYKPQSRSSLSTESNIKKRNLISTQPKQIQQQNSSEGQKNYSNPFPYKMMQKLQQNNNKLNRTIMQLKQQVIRLKQSQKEKDNLIKIIWNKVLENQKKFENLNKQLNIKMNKMNDKITTQLQSKEQAEKQNSNRNGFQKSSLKWIDLSSYHITATFRDNLKLTSKSEEPIQIFTRISPQRNHSFKIKILKLRSKIAIGISQTINKTLPNINILQKPKYQSQKNTIILTSEGQLSLLGNYKKDDPWFTVRQGNVMQMTVDSNGVIEWKIQNQKILIIHQCEKIKQESIKWVYFIMLYDKSDSIQFIP